MRALRNNLIDPDNGLVNRSIYVDKEIYNQELEQIFGRCWLFLGHESQIPKPNDFLAAYMGEDPVLLTRDSKGKLHGFLNMCRHRGNRICRADFGNAPSFMCTYHGWTFATDGKLVGVPGYKEAYFEELDRSQWGLVEAAQIDSFHGLVFATWDKKTPPLLDYLGDMAWFLDLTLNRRASGIEFVSGVHKWVIPSNWKMPSDNFAGDGYHIATTHRSIMMARGANVERNLGNPNSTRRGVYPGNGHGAGPIDINPSSYGQPEGGGRGGVLGTYYKQHAAELEKQLGPLKARYAAARTTSNTNTFPNLATIQTSFRIWHPRGPEKTEVWSYVYADKDAPDEVKKALRDSVLQSFGPSGNLEQDDMNNFNQCTSSGKSLVAQQYPMNLQLGLHHESRDEQIPGLLTTSPSEVNQRGFYSWWAKMMDAPSWDEIKLDPRKN